MSDRIPAVEPTAELVAEMLTESDNDYHDGHQWQPSISADGNVVSITITPYTVDGDECPEREFRAVVVEGDQPPIVLSRPDVDAYLGDVMAVIPGPINELEIRDGRVVNDDGCTSCQEPLVASWTPDEARVFAAYLVALAERAERNAQ